MKTNQLYQERQQRYLTALRNEKANQIPIRPFVAESTAKYAGMTCQQVAHDYNFAFEVEMQFGKILELISARLNIPANGKCL